MKILALNGSFRKNGNTEILLKQALMGAESVSGGPMNERGDSWKFSIDWETGRS